MTVHGTRLIGYSGKDRCLFVCMCIVGTGLKHVSEILRRATLSHSNSKSLSLMNFLPPRLLIARQRQAVQNVSWMRQKPSCFGVKGCEQLSEGWGMLGAHRNSMGVESFKRHCSASISFWQCLACLRMPARLQDMSWLLYASACMCSSTRYVRTYIRSCHAPRLLTCPAWRRNSVLN